MKKLLCFMLILGLVICAAGGAAADIVTQYKSEQSESYIWHLLRALTGSPQIASGITAMFWRESFFQSDICGGDYLLLENISSPFTEVINDTLKTGESKDLFIKKIHYEYGGYGLCQWSDLAGLERFYAFAQSYGGDSIACAKMQCCFIVQDIKHIYPELWKELKQIKHPGTVGKLLATYYEGSSGIEYVGEISYILYEKYTNNKLHLKLQ